MSNVFCTCIMKNHRQLILLSKTHEHLKIFEQPDSQLFMNSIHYSQWKFSYNKPENIHTRTQVQRVRTVSQLMDTKLKTKQFLFNKSIAQHLNIPPSFLQQANCNYLLQKEIVLLTICIHKSNWEKVPVTSNFQIFKQNQQTAWVPPQTCDFSVLRVFHIPPFHLFCASSLSAE